MYVPDLIKEAEVSKIGRYEWLSRGFPPTFELVHQSGAMEDYDSNAFFDVFRHSLSFDTISNEVRRPVPVFEGVGLASIGVDELD